MRASSVALAPLEAVQRFVFAPEDARRLAGLRIGLFGLLAFRLAVNDYDFVAGQPATLFDPVSLFHLLSAMPSPGLVSVLQPLAVLAAVLAMAGVFPRVSFPAAFALSVFLNLMLNATGKVVHNDVLLTLCLIPLVAAPGAATRAWSLRRPGRGERGADRGRGAAGVAYGWPIRTAMVIVGLAYLFAGLQKLRYSGIDWVTTDNLRYVLWSASDGRADPNSVGLFIADHDWLAHIFAGASLALELSFILCLPFARLRWVFIPSVVGLHLGIWLTMGLNYSAQAATAVIVFIDWRAVVAFVRRAGERRLPARWFETAGG